MSTDVTSPIGIRMQDDMEEYWKDFEEMRAIMESEGTELDLLRGNAVSIREQAYIRTATVSLSTWEEELGLPVIIDKPINERRAVIESKLRGVGTVTRAMIERVAQSYERGLVRVTEQYADYTFTVTFIDTVGIPPNVDDLKAAIEEIKPAHLKALYAYRYLTIGEVSRLTIGQMQTIKLSNFAGGTKIDE